MAHFKRLYFDTNILISSNWPRTSAALERVFDLAKLFKVQLCFPKLVEDEFDAHWIEAFRGKCSKLRNATEELRKYAAGFIKEDFDLPKEEEAFQAYRKLSQETKTEWKIETIPVTSRNNDELLKMAVEYQAPFAKDDRGFKDAIIFLSIIDDLAKHPSVVGAFLSEDKIFKDTRIGDATKAAGVSLVIYSNPDAVYNELMSWLEGAMKVGWENDKQRADEAIKQRISDIEKFLLENLEFSQNEIGFGSTLVSVKGLKVNRITNVRTPPLSERSKNDILKVSFDAHLEISAIVERVYLPPPPSRIKVGEVAPKFFGLTLGDVLSGPRQEEESFPWIAEVEAEAAPGDSDYKTLTLVSARSKGLAVSDAMIRLNTLASLLAKPTS